MGATSLDRATAFPGPAADPARPALARLSFLARVDRSAIGAARAWGPILGRSALGLVFFWFGLLKVVGSSPATDLVTALQHRTLPFLDGTAFVAGLGLFEAAIAVLLFSGRWQRLALLLLAGHMFATFLPLVLLPHLTWSGPLQPTIEGQYIVKNVVIIALAMTVASRLDPLTAPARRRG